MSAAVREEARRLLKRHWGYDSFRPLQEDIIASVMEGHDTLGLLPTGGGKSITFQVASQLMPGLTLVVTPLISLMKDQVDNLRDAGIRSAAMNSTLTRREYRLLMDRCRLGKLKLLYVSPEKLRSKSFVDDLRLCEISLIVVDEAHCISQWGFDFRPAYMKIVELRRLAPEAPVLALTASAPPEVMEDILRILEFRERVVFTKSFARDNISYLVRKCDNKESMLMKILTTTQGSTIVYARSRRRTREICETLNANGISALYYHAGLDPEVKTERQNLWKEGRVRVMVATNAFGMGIDKPDVRVVVHVDVPPSLEEYYQEAGRAGRDGNPSLAVTVVAASDRTRLRRRVSEAFPSKDYIRKTYELVGNFLEIAVGTGYNTLHAFNLEKFCQTFKRQEGMTRSSLNVLTRSGAIEYAEDPVAQARLMMLMTKHDLYDLCLERVDDTVLQTVLRTYPGLFADYVAISEMTLSSYTGLPTATVHDSLLRLSRMKVLHYIPKSQTPYVYYPTRRDETRHVDLGQDVYDNPRRRFATRIAAVEHFVFETDDSCRVKYMLNYFGEKTDRECGSCDYCREQRRGPRQSDERRRIEEGVLYLSGHPGGRTLEQMRYELECTMTDLVDVVRRLSDRGRVVINGLNVTLANPSRP